jgi:hypothetical protein
VVIVGYGKRNVEDAAADLAEAFGLSLAAARDLIRRAPVVVKSAVSEDVARQFRDVLLRTGAQIEIRPMEEPRARPIPPTRPPPAPEGEQVTVNSFRGAVTVNLPPEPEAPLAERRVREAGNGILGAMLLPFRGSGWKWLLGGSSFSVGAVALMQLFEAPPGAVVCLLLLGLGLVGITAGFHHACLTGASSGEHEPSVMGELDAGVFVDAFVIPGLRFALLALAIGVLPGIWVHARIEEGGVGTIATSPLTWVALLAPALYWPLGLAVAGVRGSAAQFFNIAAAARLVARAPVQATFLLTLALATVCLALFSISGLPGRLTALTPFIAGPTLLLAHAIHGAITGWLASNREEVFG